MSSAQAGLVRWWSNPGAASIVGSAVVYILLIIIDKQLMIRGRAGAQRAQIMHEQT